MALAATAGCGGGTSAASGAEQAVPGSSSAGPAGAGGEGATEQGFGGDLSEASDMDTLSRYIDVFTSCKDVVPGAEYDAGHGAEDTAWGTQEAADPSWGIKERAVCKDFRHPIALLLVSDMRKFQTAAKKNNDLSAIGRNYAVVPVGDDQIEALSPSGLAFLTCDPDFSPPSGHRTEKALVDGCVLSGYFPA
ncbi:hypothetical protein [Streptomyces sp. NPDC049915]|uniref:hypothetical protein n=1 Tax=Streptomyces sp. NPDC049915 TaxID=3155510 RepID=UPI00343A235C